MLVSGGNACYTYFYKIHVHVCKYTDVEAHTRDTHFPAGTPPPTPYCWPTLHPPLQSFLFSYSNKKNGTCTPIFPSLSTAYFPTQSFPPERGYLYPSHPSFCCHLSSGTLDIKEWQNRSSYKLVQKFTNQSHHCSMGITQFLMINLPTSYFQHFGECLSCIYLYISEGRSSKLSVLQTSSSHYDVFCRYTQMYLPVAKGSLQKERIGCHSPPGSSFYTLPRNGTVHPSPLPQSSICTFIVYHSGPVQ